MAEPSEPGKNESKELLEELPPAKKASLEGSHSCERPYMIDGREGAYALIQAFLPLVGRFNTPLKEPLERNINLVVQEKTEGKNEAGVAIPNRQQKEHHPAARHQSEAGEVSAVAEVAV